MTNSALISVVVPTYNRANIILDALDSVRRQTYRPVEVIIVDDGSNDYTEQVIREWHQSLENKQHFVVRYFYQKNQGANSARNRGINESVGRYVAFLDSDDRWTSQKLEKQIAIFHTDSDIGGVYCGLQYMNLETEELIPKGSRAYPEGDLLKEVLVHDVTAGAPCWIFKKECFRNIGLFDEGLTARQDWDLTIRLSAQYKIGCVPEVLVYGGTHSGERIRSNPRREIASHKVIFQKYAHLRRQFPLSVRLAARSAMYRRRGRVYFHRGFSKRKALVYQLMGIVVWPFCFDSYAALMGVFLPTALREKLHHLWNRVFGDTMLAIRSH